MDAGGALPALAPPRHGHFDHLGADADRRRAGRRDAHRRHVGDERLSRRAPDQDPRAQRPFHRLSDRLEIHRLRPDGHEARKDRRCALRDPVRRRAGARLERLGIDRRHGARHLRRLDRQAQAAEERCGPRRLGPVGPEQGNCHRPASGRTARRHHRRSGDHRHPKRRQYAPRQDPADPDVSGQRHLQPRHGRVRQPLHLHAHDAGAALLQHVQGRAEARRCAAAD